MKALLIGSVVGFSLMMLIRQMFLVSILTVCVVAYVAFIAGFIAGCWWLAMARANDVHTCATCGDSFDAADEAYFRSGTRYPSQ